MRTATRYRTRQPCGSMERMGIVVLAGEGASLRSVYQCLISIYVRQSFVNIPRHEIARRGACYASWM